MTMQAPIYPAGGMTPPLFDFAALFGRRQRAEPSWRYEAPSLEQPEPLGVPYDQPLPPPDTTSPSKAIASSTPVLSDGFFSGVYSSFSSSSELQETTSTEVHEADATAKTHTGQAQSLADVKSCFENFKKQVELAATLSGTRRRYALRKACRVSQPKIDDKGEFGLLLCRYMLSSRNGRHWTHEDVVCCLREKNLRLPHIASTGAREMLRSLDAMFASTQNGVRGLRRLYKKFAKQIAEVPHGITSAQEYSNLAFFIRVVWDTNQAHHAPGRFADPQPLIPAPVRELLHTLDHRVSDHRVRMHVISLVDDPTRADTYIRSLVTVCSTSSDPALLASVLEHIPRRLLKAWMRSLHTDFLRYETASDTTKSSPHFDVWMRALLRDIKAPGAFVPDLALRALADLVKKHHSSATPPYALAIALFHVLAEHPSLAGVSPDRLTSLVRPSAGTAGGQNATSLCLCDMATRIMIDLREASLPNHGVLEVLLPLLDEGITPAGLKPVLQLLRRVYDSGVALSETAFLKKYLKQVVQRLRQADISSERARSHLMGALCVSGHIQNVVRLFGVRVQWQSQAGSILDLRCRLQLARIVDHARDAGMLPLAFPKGLADLPRSTQIDAIHQLAHQYSLDRTRSHRQNWRSIHYLYSYLRRRHLEIRPLFTRAVLKTCIVQPLFENHFVSSRRLIWVCELVASVDGVDAAKRVEDLFWARRGEVLLDAQAALKAIGVGSRAHVSTVKRLGMM